MSVTKKLNALIVDDEAHARDALKSALAMKCPEVKIVGEANDVESCLALIHGEFPDLVFMDVQLGNQTCFDVFDQLSEKSFDVIFVTAYDHYAIPAIRLAAIDYLLKPIQLNELAKAVQRCLDFKKDKISPERLDTFIQNNTTPQKRIMLPAARGFEVVGIHEIMYCIADGNYTDFFIEGGKKITVAKTLGEYEPVLEPSGMIRIHLSHIVNVRFVKAYSGGRGGMVEMSDGRELQLSQRRKQEFLQKLGSY